ncbi:ABC transporter permease [Nesterenkonia sp. PF2B19]|uniref:ABC transporter permease n=1 Tax=Nesterenkonia sp. PF2B19 TaxID=1881858 RepID=UPI0009F7091F|nr:ABC transporter permease [Nesterenkonia sp. PF2B19]OSM44252.1 ABC transporter permease [Nesterenkonia sp. PF2B19]
MSMNRDPQNDPAPAADLAEMEDARLAQREKSYSQGQLVRRRFFAHKPAVISMIVLLSIIVVAFTSIGPTGEGGWWGKSFLQTNPVVDGGRPTMFRDGFLGEYPFGQDNNGRDYFALVMRGAQQSLIVAFGVALSSTVIGVLVGALAGYFRGWVESLLMRLTDTVIVVPLLALAAVFGSYAQNLPGGTLTLALLLGCVTWTGMARLVRAEVLSLREKEYVAAAAAMGAHPARIIVKHMLPNSVGVIIVNATFAIAAAILLETSLSFLGFGIQPPESSLGLLIDLNQNAFTTRPWLFWFPGLFIIAIALSVNFIGDGLRDAIDPRQKRTGDKRPTLRGVLGFRGSATAQQRLAARTGGTPDDDSTHDETLNLGPTPNPQKDDDR